jgi:TATA-box binding protein (TBP) (component of TFIID and TFIIIB)
MENATGAMNVGKRKTQSPTYSTDLWGEPAAVNVMESSHASECGGMAVVAHEPAQRAVDQAHCAMFFRQEKKQRAKVDKPRQCIKVDALPALDGVSALDSVAVVDAVPAVALEEQRPGHVSSRESSVALSSAATNRGEQVLVHKLARQPEKTTRFSTLMASLLLSQRVDLHILAKYAPGGNCVHGVSDSAGPVVKGAKKRLAMDNTASMCIRMRDEGAGRGGGSYTMGLTIFANGQVVVTGARKYEDVLAVSRRLISRVRRSVGRDHRGMLVNAVEDPGLLTLAVMDGCDENRLRIDMVKVDFALGVSLRLEALFELLRSKGYVVAYEPEGGFPGVRVKLLNKAVTVALYRSGKGFITSGGVSRTVAFGEWSAEVDKGYAEVAGLIWANLDEVVNLQSMRVVESKKTRA